LVLCQAPVENVAAMAAAPPSPASNGAPKTNVGESAMEDPFDDPFQGYAAEPPAQTVDQEEKAQACKAESTASPQAEEKAKEDRKVEAATASEQKPAKEEADVGTESRPWPAGRTA
jgi:hypothetical protein